MKLVERHIIPQGHKLFKVLDDLAFKSKNLYNASLYQIRQHFFNSKEFLSYESLQKQFQNQQQPDYRALPAKVSQWTMKMVSQNFKAFFNANREYGVHPEKFTGKPKIPTYLDKENGRYLVTYTIQAISKKEAVKDKIVHLSGTDVKFHTNVAYGCIQQVRIVNRTGYYVIEVVYNCNSPIHPIGDNGKYAAIDLGIDNFATVTTNIRGIAPMIIDGRVLKSVNRYFNKEIAKAKSVLEKRNGKKSSRKTRRLMRRRSNIISDYMHKASRQVVNQLVSNGVGILIIGKNDGWKQDTNMGAVNNQKFMGIPHEKFISMLNYKCEMAGISVILQEESYTSKASFLDLDKIPVYGRKDVGEARFSGYRKHRGLYVRKDGKGTINADVNGSYNILRKCKPKAFTEGVSGLVVAPFIIKMTNRFNVFH